MQKTHLLLLLASLTLAFSTAQAGNKAKHEGSDVSLEEQPFAMPSYDQFRKMSDAKQEAYIQEVREMLGAITADGVEVSFFDSLNVNVTAKWTAFMSLLNKEASADTGWCSDYTFSDDPKGVCVTSARGGVTCGKSDGAVMTQYVKNCPSKFAAGAPDSWKATKDSKSKQYVAQSDVANDKVAAETKAKEEAAATGSGTVQANPTGGGAPKEVKPTFQSNSTADTSLDKKGKKFRCIYAGFTIYGDKCTPQDKYVDPKTNSVYTCAAPTAGDKDYGIIAPAKVDSKKSVLCNPVFFGTVPDGSGSNGSYPKQKPICVAKGKSATADCLKAANADKAASLKSAVKFAKDDKAKYQEITDTLTKLCQPAGAFTPKSDLSESSKKDLEATCKTYRERMFDYASAYGAATSSGIRAGPMANIPGAQ